VNAQIQYGSAAQLTSAPTHEPLDAQHRCSLRQFRHSVASISDQPSRPDLQRLLQLASDLKLHEAEIGEELALIRALDEGIDLVERVAQGDLPVVPTVGLLARDHQCHFIAPVRSGRRRSDHFGHLIFSSGWLKFRATADVSIPWSNVAQARRCGREIVVSQREGRRVLRFGCHSIEEAVRGTILAQHLASVAQSPAPPEPKQTAIA
jgi:hypothetical protein